jgi:Mn2+/Fe2+ NRAMP family transporter
MIFFGQSNVVEKGSTVKDMFFVRADVFSGAVAACLVVWFIMITTGTVLHGQGIAVENAAEAARALVPTVGPAAERLFGAGLVGASFLAACVLPLTTSYAICEAFGWERGSETGREKGSGVSWREAPAYKGIITAIIAVSCIVVLVPEMDLMAIMLSAQVINGILLPILLVFLLLIANNRYLMGTSRNGRLANILSVLTIIAVLGLTVALLVFQFLGYVV